MPDNIRNFTNPRKLEPLIVIVVLSAIIAISINPLLDIQKKGRDNKRKADLVTIVKAMEFAKADSPGGFYPPKIDPTEFKQKGYINEFPKDPKDPETKYIYNALPQNCTTKCTDYTVTACLENNKDQEKDTTKYGCANFPASYTTSSI
mgnify:CR=1 FL=1